MKAALVVIGSLSLMVACGGSQSAKPAVAEATNAAKAEVAASGTIVDIAATNGSFNTLVTAIKAAGLVDTLSGEGPFTVFAPTDEAFAKLPPGALDSLIADKDQLTQVLTYHVVSGKVPASAVAGLSSATTLQGGELPVDTSDGVKVGEATVVTTDIEASNGIIHVIDTVLIPGS